MAYKFNNGRGAVICDNCRVMIDADLSFKEYEECYNGAISGDDGDFCTDCRNPGSNKKKDLENWKNKLKEADEMINKRDIINGN
jgi:hypothetical protein